MSEELPAVVDDWGVHYRTLKDRGYSDGQIADMAGVSRFVINRVRLDKYENGSHHLRYEGGVRILRAVNSGGTHASEGLNTTPA